MYLITQSLFSSWEYSVDVPGDPDAKEEFLRVLRREKSPPTDAMLNGLAFEEECYKAARGEARDPHPVWEKGIQQIARCLTGATIQLKASRKITVDGIDFLVYGILDALRAGRIMDVKFLNKSMANAELAGKYLYSPQHPVYFYIVPEAQEFTYLVSDGEDVYCESYTRSESEDISVLIHQFIRSMSAAGLLDLYKEHWKAKG